MILRSIEFKEKFLLHENPESFKIKFDPNLLFITGPNGYGKTTILDLVYQMIIKNDIDDDLKDKVGTVLLKTSQGTIIYDHTNGLQKDNLLNFCMPQIRYKKQENEGYKLTEEDVQIILNNQQILDILVDYLDKREEPVFDMSTGKLLLRNIRIGNTFPVDEAPVSLQNLLMMLIFAVQTRKGDILLLDHPEEHLHIAYQRILIEKLSELCRGQLIVTTHSTSIFSKFGFSATKDLFYLK